MSFVGLLQFSLKCFDVLAWPLVALVYPLCASVRAIETNSNCHMRKLVTYWVLFSLISLFELALVRVIEWLPFLPQIKLLFVCWLVIPRFDGAYYVYKSLVHLCLSVDRQSVVKWLNKPKDDVSLKPETFLAVAETYVQKNGTEALEKLIASKSKDSNSNLIVEEIKSAANAKEKEVATTIQKAIAAVEVEEMTEPTAHNEDKLQEPPEKNAAVATKWTKKKAVAVVEVKEMTEPTACKEDKLLEPPEKNATVAAKLVSLLSIGSRKLSFKGFY
ncbi:unnamed protein product [Ilex paraguariensis]|uniref:HVA22-like protein n=1 Tax=Ilex paraguariensis TaxID=185542 RepID=A0ABC8T6Y8_9AQUA